MTYSLDGIAAGGEDSEIRKECAGERLREGLGNKNVMNWTDRKPRKLAMWSSQERRWFWFI